MTDKDVTTVLLAFAYKVLISTRVPQFIVIAILEYYYEVLYYLVLQYCSTHVLLRGSFLVEYY
jgi:hypothetical protein